jgi:hypothetical protein
MNGRNQNDFNPSHSIIARMGNLIYYTGAGCLDMDTAGERALGI